MAAQKNIDHVAPAANTTHKIIPFTASATATAIPIGITVEQLREFGQIDWDGEIWDESCFEGVLDNKQENVKEKEKK
jgi:hypothetical protein